MHKLFELLQDPKWVAAVIAGVVGGLWKLIKSTTNQVPAFKRKDAELEAMADRETEVVVAAEEFSKDAELERRGAHIVELSIENQRLEARIRWLEEGQLDLEMREAEARVTARTAQTELKRVTSKHKVLPDPERRDTVRDGDIITDRPERPKRPPLPLPKLPPRIPPKR